MNPQLHSIPTELAVSASPKKPIAPAPPSCFSDSFVPRRWLKNGHAQTLFAAFGQSHRFASPLRTHLLPLVDGDSLVIHEHQPRTLESQSLNRTIVIFHGLCGSTESVYMRRIADRCCNAGYSTFAVNSRGCGAGSLHARNHTHAGRTDDMANALKFVASRRPDHRMTVVGFSLNGNTLLNYLGKTKKSNIVRQMDSAIAVAPPIDLIACSKFLKTGLARFYDQYFARQSMSHLVKRRKATPNLVDHRIGTRIESIKDFDDAFTARIAGYRDATDYYYQTSSIHHLNSITLPTKILVARDDPVVPHRMFESSRFRKPLDLCITRFGGHLGYVGRDNSENWMDNQICKWINEWQRSPAAMVV